MVVLPQHQRRCCQYASIFSAAHRLHFSLTLYTLHCLADVYLAVLTLDTVRAPQTRTHTHKTHTYTQSASLAINSFGKRVGLNRKLICFDAGRLVHLHEVKSSLGRAVFLHRLVGVQLFISGGWGGGVEKKEKKLLNLQRRQLWRSLS